MLSWKPPVRQGSLQAAVYRAAKSRVWLRRPWAQRRKAFFACGSPAAVRAEQEGGAAAWLAGTLAAPSEQGRGLPLLQELWPYQSLSSKAIRRPLWPVFLRRSAHSGTQTPPDWGPTLRVCGSGTESGALGGASSVAHCVRRSRGQPLYCPAADAGVWGERGYGDGSTPTRDSAVLPASMAAWLYSPALPTHPFSLSLRSQQQPSPWGCSTVPKLQLPAAAPSRGPVFLSGVCVAAARTVWFSFRLGSHRSAVSPSAFNVSPLTQTIAPMWGLDPCFSSLQPRAGPFLLTLLFPPPPPPVPSSYWVLRGSI